MNVFEINNRSGLIADTVVQMLRSDGVSTAQVYVTHGFAYDYPLAIRTLQNEGFGDYKPGNFEYILDYKGLATLQAKYSLVVGGRTAAEQQENLTSRQRNSASYGVDFPADLVPGFAMDDDSGLIVVTIADLLTRESVNFSLRAIKDVSDSKTPDKLLEAAKLVHKCLDTISGKLPPDRSGFAMVGLRTHIPDWHNSPNRGPIIVCSQASGGVVSPANFAVVAAKLQAVTQTGSPSGPRNFENQPTASQIEGALPILIRGLGTRVVAVGGLPDGADDVRAIRDTIVNNPTRYNIRVID